MKITKEDIRNALSRLSDAKSRKSADDARMRENDKWWKMKWWELHPEIEGIKPTSAWMFNSIINKHADAMDNTPSPVILPGSEDDRETAALLGKAVPAVLESCDWREVYSDVWWDKLRYGTGVFGVFWDSMKNASGDISLKRIDPKSIYFDGGIDNIQDSKEVFYLENTEPHKLRELYPKAKIETGSLVSDDGDAGKVVLVNWYYKKDGKIHFCRFCGEEVLFASENEKGYENGWYNHGKYPFIVDRLFPTFGGPLGFGFIDTMKSSQMYIDLLGKCIIENALMSSRKRFFLRDDGSINENEFLDFTNPIIHSSGNLGEDSIREFTTQPLSEIYMRVLNHKIDEIKETSGNRDFSQGSTASGVTAASAIAALQEAGSKLSRDMLKTSYRAFREMCYLVIELMRQFYTVPRVYRVSGEEFITLDNAVLTEKEQTAENGVIFENRLPMFDIIVEAEKGSQYSKGVNNELAKELFRMGFFNEQRRAEALSAISMMDFDGKEELLSTLQVK